MKNLILLILSALIFQSSVAFETETPDLQITEYGPTTKVIGQLQGMPPTAPALNVEVLNDFTPEKPRPLKPAELKAMFGEMKSMNRLSRANFKKLLARVKYIQYSFEFTLTSGVQRNRELRTYLIFTCRAIQVDPSTESKEYFHNAYDIYKTDFDRVMSTLSPAQRADLYNADEEAKRIQANPIQDDFE